MVIPAPVATRWNSHQMMISGLTQLREPLEQFKQNTPGWENVPTADEFNLLKKLLLVLSCFRETSESLSTDKKVCIHKMLLFISFLRQKIEQAKIGEDPDGPMVQWCNALKEELDKRFPEGGIKIEAYAMGNLFDPLFRGSFLKKANFQKRYEDGDLVISNERDALVKKIIEEHTSTKAYHDRHNNKNNDVNAELQSQEKDIDEILRMHLDEMAFPTGPENEDQHPPLEREFKRYFAFSKVDLDVSFNLK